MEKIHTRVCGQDIPVQQPQDKRGFEGGVQKLQTISLEQYVAEIDKEEARMKGMEEGKFGVAHSMLAEGFSAEIIKKCTGIDENNILSLR
jgi:hypothetical protein